MRAQNALLFQKYVSSNNPCNSRFFCSATQVKFCRAGLGTGWVTQREYRREGPYFVLPFLFHFGLYCGVFFRSVLKSILSIISAAEMRKKNTHTHKHGSTGRVEIVLAYFVP